MAAWSWPKLDEIVEDRRGSARIIADQDYELWSVPSFSLGAPEVALGETIGSAKRPVKPGDVLLCKINPRINRVWVVEPSSGLEQIASTEWIVLRPRDVKALSSRWLQHYLASPSFRKWIVSEISGATGSHTRAKPREVLKQAVPLPPLPEQERIVAILDEAFSAIATATANAEKNLANARELFRNELNRIFAQNGDGWDSQPLDQLADQIDYGHTASAKHDGGEPKFLRITDIQDGRVDWDAVPSCECDLDDRMKYRLEPGDIVFARTGATTGKSFLISECPESSVFASYLIRVRPNDRVVPEFLARFFQSSMYWQQVSREAAGAAQPGVNATKLRNLQVSLAPIHEQTSIVSILDVFSAKTQSLIDVYERKAAALSELKQSILHKALRGRADSQSKGRRTCSLGGPGL